MPLTSTLFDFAMACYFERPLLRIHICLEGVPLNEQTETKSNHSRIPQDYACQKYRHVQQRPLSSPENSGLDSFKA